MGVRTYIPKLIYLLKTVCRYIARWNSQLREFLTPEQETYLNAVMVACEAFVNSVEQPEEA